jgi:hypothetical protein
VGYYWDVTFNEQPGDLKPMKCVADGYYYKTNAYDGEKFCNVTTIQDGSLLDGYFMLGTTYPHEYVHYPRNYNSSYIRRDIEADTLATLLQDVTVKCNESNSGSYHGASPYVDHQVAGQQGMDAIYYWDDCPSYEGDSVWGELTIERNSYTPSADDRWSGGYAWTITFTTRPGNVPQMSSSRDLPKLTESFPLDYENEYPSLTVDFDKALITQKSSVDSTVEVADEQGTSSVDIYQGKDNYFVFSVDEPTVSARDGNQIIGDFGLSYDGVTSSQSAFSIQVIDMVGNDPAVTKNASYEAMSAKKFKHHSRGR